MKGYVSGKIYYKHEKEADKLRMGGGSWTINLSWIKMGVEEVCYITEIGEYRISFPDAVKFGFRRIFQGEEKLVVPCKNWNFVSSRRMEVR